MTGNEEWWTASDADLADAIAKAVPPYTAVVDTNVLMDISSCHDLMNAFVKVETPGSTPTPEEALRIFRSPELQPRRERARDGLLVAIHLDATRAKTFCAGEEYTRILSERVPVSTSGTVEMETAYTTLWLHLVHDRVLTGWSSSSSTLPESIRGSAVDDALIRFAGLGRLPLVTNEAPNAPKKIPDKATALGVTTMTPGQFAQVTDEQKRAFMIRFQTEAKGYFAERERAHGLDKTPDAVDFMDTLFGRLLFDKGQ